MCLFMVPRAKNREKNPPGAFGLWRPQNRRRLEAGNAVPPPGEGGRGTGGTGLEKGLLTREEVVDFTRGSKAAGHSYICDPARHL